MKKNSESLISLNISNKKKVELSLKEATKNVFITGSTGTGKTSSILLPMINNLIKNKCPGLVLDIKSNLYSHIYEMAKNNSFLDKICFIGPYDFCEEINILSSISTPIQLRNILTAMRPFKIATEQNYWWNSGLDDVIDIIKIHSWYITIIKKETYQYNFNIINDYINKIGFTKNIVDEINQHRTQMTPEIISILEKIKSEPFSLYNTSINTPNSTDITSQKMWRSGQVSSLIQPYLEKNINIKINNFKENKTIYDLIYKEGKIIVLIMPIEYEDIGYSLAKMFREIYFKAVLKNNETDFNHYKIGQDYDRYTFLMIDEYQFYLNNESSNGVITDENWTGISRSYNNINIFATQSISSLISKSNSSAEVDTIIQNCVNEIHLGSKDKNTYEHIVFLTNDYKNSHTLIKNTNNIKVGICRFSSPVGTILSFFDLNLTPENKEFHKKEYSIINQNNIKYLNNIKIKKDIDFIKNKKIIYYNDNFILLENSEKYTLEEFYNTKTIKNLLDELKKEFNDFYSFNLFKNFLKTSNFIFNEKNISILFKVIKDFKKNKYDSYYTENDTLDSILIKKSKKDVSDISIAFFYEGKDISKLVYNDFVSIEKK